MIELDRDEPISYPEPMSYITSHKTEKEKVEKKKVESKPKPVHEVAPVEEEPIEIIEVKEINNNKKVGHIMAEY